MSSQETGDTQEDHTQEQLLQIIASQKEMLDQQSAMISNLTQELQTLKCSLTTQSKLQFTQVPASVASSEPQVTFASSLFTTNPNAALSGAVSSPRDTKLFTASGGGAKVKVKRHQERHPVITIDDSSEDTSDSDTTETSEESPDVKSSDRELQQFAELVGRKGCPKPEVYSLESGRSFPRFLKSFELYCSSRYSRKEKDLWTSELGRLLKGEARQVFDACGGPDQRYSRMKRALENWHDDVRERISSSRRSQYKNVKYQDEGYKIFATRLEHLFRAAYPNRQLDGKDLRRTLMGALPRSVAETLERDLALLKAASGRHNTWQEVLRLLEIQDETVRRSISQGAASPVPRGHQLWSSPSPYTAMAVQKQHPQLRQQAPVRKWTRPKSPKKSSRICSWCKKPGHHYDYCRRRLNQCLRCGADNHRIAQCPQTGAIPKVPVRRSSSQSHTRASSSSSSSDSDQKRGRSRTQRRHRERIFTRSQSASQALLNPKPLA